MSFIGRAARAARVDVWISMNTVILIYIAVRGPAYLASLCVSMTTHKVNIRYLPRPVLAPQLDGPCASQQVHDRA